VSRLGLSFGLGLRGSARLRFEAHPRSSCAKSKHTLAALIQHLDLYRVTRKLETRQSCGDRRINVLSGSFYH
jgi:hypothetical protein